MTDVVVTGHICVDLIPTLSEAGFRYRPGALVKIGPVAVSTGGCVPNTGVALHRLGIAVRLPGKVGEDPSGGIVRESLSEIDRGLAEGILVDPGENTSYTVVLNPPGEDRMFLHFSGANDAFAESDVPEEALSGARVFHFGYPPIMRRMYEEGGENLARMLERAKEAGLTTSLDMDRGWRRRETTPGEGWVESERGGVWAGPRDRGPAGETG